MKLPAEVILSAEMPEARSHKTHTLVPDVDAESNHSDASPGSAKAFQQQPPLELSSEADDLVLVQGAGAARVPPRHTLRRTPVWGATVNSISFMCVPRGIPACFAATGWPLGIVSMAYSSAVTYNTGILIGKICAVLPANCSSFPGIAAEAGGALSASLGHDGQRQARWRRTWLLGVAVLQHSCYYLTGVSELIYFEQYLGQLFDDSPLCQWQWLLIVAAISLPAMQVHASQRRKPRACVRERAARAHVHELGGAAHAGRVHTGVSDGRCPASMPLVSPPSSSASCLSSSTLVCSSMKSSSSGRGHAPPDPSTRSHLPSVGRRSASPLGPTHLEVTACTPSSCARWQSPASGIRWACKGIRRHRAEACASCEGMRIVGRHAHRALACASCEGMCIVRRHGHRAKACASCEDMRLRINTQRAGRQ